MNNNAIITTNDYHHQHDIYRGDGAHKNAPTVTTKVLSFYLFCLLFVRTRNKTPNKRVRNKKDEELNTIEQCM